MQNVLLTPSLGIGRGLRCVVIDPHGGFAFTFGVNVGSYSSEVFASLTDFITKEKLIFSEPSRIPGKKMGVLTHLENGGIAYTSDYCDYTFTGDESGIHLLCKYKKCFFHSDFEAEAHIYMPSYDLKDGTSALCCPAEGAVKVCEREYSFRKADALACVECFKLNKKHSCESIKSFACAYIDGKPFGYCISCDGDFSNAEGFSVYGDNVFSLDNMSVSIPADVMGKWTMCNISNVIRVQLSPFFNDREDHGVFSAPRYTDGLFCSLSGVAVTPSGEELPLHGINAHISYSHKRF